MPPIAAECHIASLIPGVTWKGCYDGGGRVQRDWNRHEEREMVQDRLGLLASRPAETTPAPRCAGPLHGACRSICRVPRRARLHRRCEG